MRSKRNSWLVAGLVAIAACAGLLRSLSDVPGARAAAAGDAPTAAAPPTARKISVSGVGQAKGKPSYVELMGTVMGEAELAGDAVVKHRDAKRRAVQAIQNLKVAGLTIEEKGVAVNRALDPNAQQMMMRGQVPNSTGLQRVQVTEQLRLVLKDVDKLKDEELVSTVLKVVDTAKDAGMNIGPAAPMTYQQMMNMSERGTAAGIASFKIPNIDELRQQAYKLAMDDARNKAQRLAELSGSKLARVVSVTDSTSANRNMTPYGQMLPLGPDEVSSNVFGEIPLTVSLAVEFAIE